MESLLHPLAAELPDVVRLAYQKRAEGSPVFHRDSRAAALEVRPFRQNWNQKDRRQSAVLEQLVAVLDLPGPLRLERQDAVRPASRWDLLQKQVAARKGRPFVENPGSVRVLHLPEALVLVEVSGQLLMLRRLKIEMNRSPRLVVRLDLLEQQVAALMRHLIPRSPVSLDVLVKTAMACVLRRPNRAL